MAKNYCKAELLDTKALTALKRIIGADENLLYSVVSECISYDKFTEGFTEYYKNDTKQEPAFDAGNGIKMANRMLAYYRRNHPRLNDTVRTTTKNNKVTDYGYESILDREDGKQFMSEAVLSMFNDVQSFGIKIKGNPIDYYTARLQTQAEDNILKEAAKVSKMSLETLRQEYEDSDDRTAYLESKLGKEPSVTSKNLLAIYKELNGTEKARVQYIDELFCNPILQPVFSENKDALEAFNESVGDTAEADSTTANKEAYAVEGDDVDSFIGQANSHAGLHSNFMKHVSIRIKTYFDTLPKLASKEKVTNDEGQKIWINDTNNRFGLPKAMGAERCCTMLYGGSANYNSIMSMIDYVETIGRTVKGFESFLKFAEDLRSDPDFAYEVFTVFAKTVMDKVQVVVSTGEGVVRVSNERASRHNAFIFNLMNDVKSTAIDVDPVWVEHQVDRISSSINSLKNKISKADKGELTPADTKKVKDTKLALCENISKNVARLIKIYYPSVDTDAVVSYIEMYKDAGTNIEARLDNAMALLDVVNNTRAASIKTSVLWTQRAAKIKEYSDNNAQIERDLNNNKFRSFEDYSPIEEAYAMDYLSQDQKKAYIQLCNMLVPYSVVNLQLTTPNVKGNNQSSVMNNSYITNLKKLLDNSYTEYVRDSSGKVTSTRTRNPALERWGTQKLQDVRYRESTILLEHRTEDGELINPGIFRYDTDGKLVLTEDGPRLLQVSLFDGSSDMDKGTNQQYKEMTQGSFFPTAFIQFFKTEQLENSAVKVARYFPRTPSDSTTMFSIQAPRYDTSDLYRIKDRSQLNTIAQEAIDSIPIVNPKQYASEIENPQAKKILEELPTPAEELPYTLEEYRANYNVKESLPLIIEKQADKNDKDIEIATLGDYILGKGIIKVPQGTRGYSARFAKEPGDKNLYRVSIAYGDNSYVFVGKKRKRGKLDILDDIKIKAIIPRKGDGTMPEALVDYLKGQLTRRLEKGNIVFNEHRYNQPELELNPESNIFRIYKQQFKQELLEVALALDHYFELDDDGWVKNGDKLNESSEKVIKTKVSNTEGYAFYHLDGDGKVLNKKDGKFVLGGKAFHSSKFTLSIKDENGNEVKKNFLDEVISTGVEPVGEDLRPKEDGCIHLLYGGVLDSYLHVIRDTNSPEAKKPIIGVRLTETQERLVDQKIAEYITEYIKQFKEYTQDKTQFIKSVEVNQANIVEYAINHNIFLMQADDLLDGSSKFYKDAQTILKRAKEYEGSGVPYGLVDYFDEDKEDKIINDSYLNTGTFKTKQRVKTTAEDGTVIWKKEDVVINIQDFFKQKGLHDCRQKKQFRGVTVYNTKFTNTQLLNDLSKQLAKAANIDISLAKDILFGPVEYNSDGSVKTVDGKPDSEPIRSGGFTETKVNDAQSYITLEEWIRRIAARGQLKRHMPLIQKLLDENAVLTADDLKEFVQVQKNFYFDLHYDKEFGIEVPRQIKNAEFVLVPRLIQGTQLAKVYELMIQNKIDQLNTLETSKAANKDVLTLWDNEGNLVGVDDFNKNANAKAQTYSYKYLYTQQETPQHMNAQNKAGIQIVKKIIDNIPRDHELWDKKEEYMKLFVQNIRDSYNSLMDELEVDRDENGNIIIENGQIRGFNKQLFYEKLRDEFRRLGLDSNLIDYVTLDEDTQSPRMPSHMNNVITKLESVTQAMFNSSITRQKLPGFHAAQVTNIGWAPFGAKVEGVSYDKTLQYHPDAYRNKNDQSKIISERQYINLPAEERKNYEKTKANYIEVMLPLSTFGIDRNSAHYRNMTDEQILAELEDDGLDIIMGYRIPTEGKQSVCNMKVVGFTSDAYGSTIIVPNEWVAQTGSDFDIDSVYGINYETYKDKDGRLRKEPYYEDADKITFEDYTRLVNKEARRVLNRSERNASRDTLKKLRENLNARYNTLNALQKDEFEKLNVVLPKLIKTTKSIIARTIDQIKKQQPHLLGKEYKSEYNTMLIDARLACVESYLKKNGNSQMALEIVKPYKEALEALKTFFTEDLVNYSTDKKEEIESLANAAGLPTFEEFKAGIRKDHIAGNTRAARNNRILDNMKDILNHPSSLEENLSRSNFDDIIYWRNQVMNENVKKARNNRSSYNPMDQFRYQEDAMSGATLKGFSVSLDTFCSVCNTVQPKLAKPIYIVYDAKDFNDIKGIKKRFNQVSYKDKAATFSVRHDTYGWSNDNRAINGKILTAHSSQTTAHILDAIKEGAIPGVNEFTFPVYKTLLNIGSDYKTAISFIMQPGVDRIVQAYNSNNSVFSGYSENPVHQAIRSIAKDLIAYARENGHDVEQIDNRTPLISILATLNGIYKDEFNEIFRQEGNDELSITFKDSSLQNIPLIVPKLYNRLKGEREFKNSSPVKEMLFDLGNILAYHRLNKIARSTGDIARCCNPDKFGAKQTVYETNKVFEDIHDCLMADDNGVDVERTPILYVGSEDNPIHILKSIYPGCEDYTDENPAQGIIAQNDIMKSSYPTLFAYLKYATATSTIIAKDMFITQSLPFVRCVKGITSVMSGFRPRLDEATYTDLQKYILSYHYNDTDVIKHPIRMVKDEEGYHLEPVLGITDDEGSALEERTRIFGFNCTPTVSFEVNDIKDPTQEELDAFGKLSPAQKIEWLQKNLEDSANTIFGLISTSLYNNKLRRSKTGMQTIEYVDENLNPNVVYGEFYKAFYNDNPFIQMAAIDIIKYAVVVEGLRMSKTGVTKTIDNEPLIEDFGINGLGFINAINLKLSKIRGHGSISDRETSNLIYERYLRSHPECPNIRKIYMTKANEAKYGFKIGLYGVIHSPIDSPTDKIDADTAKKNWYERLRDAGIMMYDEAGSTLEEQYTPNKYVRIQKGAKSMLYKIRPISDGIILYPLTPLESNETSKYSAKPSNNTRFPTSEVYERMIDQFDANQDAVRFDNSTLGPIVAELQKAGLWETYEAPKTPNKIEPKEFDVEEIDSVAGPIREHFAKSTEPLFINNRKLTEYIFTADPMYGSPQVVTMEDGTQRQFNIQKVNDKGYKETYLKKNPKTLEYVLSKAEFDRLITQESNPQIREAIQNARAAKLSTIDTLFKVVPVVQAMNASKEELDAPILSYMRVEARNDNELAIEGLNTIKFNGVEATEGSVKENTAVILRAKAKFAKFQAQQLKTDFEHFVEDPLLPGNYLSMTDDRVQALLEGNAPLLEKYQKLINTIIGFNDAFEHYKAIDPTGEDVELDKYLEDIKEAIKDVSKLNVLEAANKLANGYYTKLSANTLVKSGLIKIMDGYYKTYGSMWMFNDIMEAGNPLLQTVLKDVMGNIESKRLAHKRIIDEYHKKRDAILAEAKAAGKEVNLDKCYDEDGVEIQQHTQAFEDKIKELRSNMLSAAENYGMGSIEHLQAKLEFDIFKAKYVNQEVRPEYYIDKARWDKTLLNKYPKLFSRYKKLRYEQADIYSYTDGELSDEAIKRLKEIDKELEYLLNPYYYLDSNGEVKSRPTYYPGRTYTQEEQDVMDMSSEEAVAYLQEYMDAEKERNDKYFEYSGAYGFEELVAKNRAIVISYENRDMNGVPERPINVLMQDPIYANAKNWLADNAYFQLRPSQAEKDKADSLYNRLQKALDVLKLNSGGKSRILNRIIKSAKLDKNINLRDEHGIVDGRLLTKAEKEYLKSAMRDGYLMPVPDGSDRKLISSAPKVQEQYSKTFWLHISPNVGFQGRPLPDTDENLRLHHEEFMANETVLNYAEWRAWKGDEPKRNYYSVITEINSILEQYYRHSDGVVHFDDIPDTPEGIAVLTKLGELYQKLRTIENGNSTDEELEERRKWMDENVEYEVNKTAYLAQAAASREKSAEWQEAWKLVNLERKKNGHFVVTDGGKVVPNRRLYSVLKAKGEPGTEQHDKWLDKKLTEASKLVSHYYTKTETVYYKQAQAEAINRAKVDPDFSYEEWYKENHVYNPYTRRYEPLDCWTTTELNQAALSEANLKGEWVPKGQQRQRKVKDGTINGMYVPTADMRNEKYKEGAGLAANYAGVNLVDGTEDTVYKNNIDRNEFEDRMVELIRDTLTATGRNKSQKEHWASGHMPVEKLHKKSFLKRAATEAGKFVGASIGKKEATKQKHEDLDYIKDELPPMPMSQMIRDVELGSVDFNLIEPKKHSFVKDGKLDLEAYNKAHKEWEDAKDEALQKNREVHRALLNRDWYNVVDTYLDKASQYNAVQDNKQKLYYLYNMLKQQKVYMREHNGYGGLKKIDDKVTHGEDQVYDTTVDDNLLKQYTTFMQRILFGQWKDDEGFLSDLGTRMQGLTSSSYMMLNIRGGFSNVTLGETGILSEAVGREIFGRRDWGFGTNEWRKGLIGRARGMYKDIAYNKQDAIIKYFLVVDYDEWRGVSTEFEMEKYSERLRNFMFSPQTIGEDFMQNSVLFAMLHSHKIVDIENDPLGIGKTYMSERDYINYRMGQELEDILTDEQKEAFTKWKQEVTSDKDKLAEYAWYRRDILTDFVYLHCHKSNKAKREGKKNLSASELQANRADHNAQINKFLKEQEARTKKFKEEFAQLEDMYSQCELGTDGKLSFKEGSALHDLSNQFVGGENVTGTEALLGRFTERVRKVNNKIHGVYNKLGRAYIEKRWYGALVMQYHKHLPVGLLKRYRNRGYFNETRGTVDKGMIATAYDFLKLNADKVKLDYGWDTDNVNAVKSLQFMLAHCLDYIMQLKTTWDIVPHYERANLKRNLGDLIGVLAGLTTVIGLIAYDDDDNDSLWYNFMLYEGDRLASEAFLYNPLGLWTETKTLMSTPVAAQSILSDALKAIINITNYDETFKTGRFAGQNKLKVYLTRRIPGYGGIRSLLSLPDNNRYYKIGDTIGTIVPTRQIGEWIGDMFD